MKSIKTISVFALAAFAFAGCQTELELTPASPFKFGEEITITASQEMGTKTCLGQEGAVLWGIGDQISVFYGDGDNGGNQFISQNEAPAATAEFKGTLTTVTGVAEGNDPVAKKFWGVSPYNADIALADGVITTSVPQLQDALENNFDFASFPAVACSDNLSLPFRNAFGLLEISLEVEGVHYVMLNGHNDEVLWGPCSIALDNGIPVVTMTGDPNSVEPNYLKVGIKSIGDDPLSTSCKYYMALPPTTFTDGVEIVLYDKELKEITHFSGEKEVKIERNKVHAVTLTAPAPQPALERVWGFYKVDDTPWYATTNITGVSIAHPDNYGMARSLAMDDEYIYLPKSSGYANVAAVSIADKTTQKALNKTGVSGGSTFATSFVRVIKNSDAEVNGGKDILLLCNLTETKTDEAQLKLYAYKDGVDAAPTKIAAFCWDSANSTNDWRRYGDRFSVTGTYQGGNVYFPSFNANKTVVLSIANGARTAVTQIAAGADNCPDGIKDVTIYPGSNTLFYTNASIANLVAPTGGKVNGWDEYALSSASVNGKGTWGYNFFEFEGKNYIAYARISGNKAWIEVILDKGDLITSLAAQEGLMKSPIHDPEDLDAEQPTGGVADCCVRIINGVPYIAALTRDGGFVLDKLVLK